MSKEIELRAADDLAAQINKDHAEIMAKVDSVKGVAAEIGAMANKSAHAFDAPALELSEGVTIRLKEVAA